MNPPPYLYKSSAGVSPCPAALPCTTACACMAERPEYGSRAVRLGKGTLTITSPPPYGDGVGDGHGQTVGTEKGRPWPYGQAVQGGMPRLDKTLRDYIYFYKANKSPDVNSTIL